jgi:predicted dehydrogenase
VNSKRHRLAIIGTGTSVGNHLEAYDNVRDRVELVAAVDINEARLREVAQANGIPRIYTDVSRMLAAEKPDLVSIITPPATHKDLAIQCMEAGAWVYCEKPLCASLAEFDAITEAEQRTGRYVSTVFQWRFGSAGKHLKRLIQTEAFGRPLVAVCNTLWYRTQDYYNVSWRGKWKTEVGGPTLGLGIHLMDMFLWLMGEWDEVRAMAGTLDRQIEVEDVSMALVRFTNGAMASVINSALSPRQETSLRLDFQKATLELTTIYRYSNEHWRISLPQSIDAPEVLSHWEELKEDLSGSHGVQLGELLDSMERNERPLVSGLEARRILEFIASLYKSAFTGKPVLRGEIDASDPFYYAMNGAAEITAR